MIREIALAAFVLSSGPAYADMAGNVVGVHDGDTLTLLVDNQRQVKVRLADIDAPELGQPFGTVSRQALSSLVFGKHITVTDEHPDRYGRTVGQITVPCPTAPACSVNAEMVREGMAWVYTRYNSSAALPGVEAEARAARRGLWAAPSPVAPWNWRAREKVRRS